MKKTIGIILTMCMALCVTPTTAFAGENELDISTVQEVMVNTDLSIPGGDDCVYYKFTPPETGNYGIESIRGKQVSAAIYDVTNGAKTLITLGGNSFQVGDKNVEILSQDRKMSEYVVFEKEKTYLAMFNTNELTPATTCKIKKYEVYKNTVSTGIGGSISDWESFNFHSFASQADEIRLIKDVYTQLHLVITPVNGQKIEGIYIDGDVIDWSSFAINGKPYGLYEFLTNEGTVFFQGFYKGVQQCVKRL